MLPRNNPVNAGLAAGLVIVVLVLVIGSGIIVVVVVLKRYRKTKKQSELAEQSPSNHLYEGTLSA